MNIKYVSAAALVNHRATRDLQLHDCVWSLATQHLIHSLPHSAVMALLRTAVWSEIVGIDYWLQLWLDIQSVPQESVNNLKRKFRPCCTVIRAQLAITVQQLPVRQGGWEPTQRQGPLSTSPSVVSTAPAWPSSAAIGFGFLAAAWCLHTFNELCHFTVQTWVGHRWAGDTGMWRCFGGAWDLTSRLWDASGRYGSIIVGQKLILWSVKDLFRADKSNGCRSRQNGN